MRNYPDYTKIECEFCKRTFKKRGMNTHLITNRFKENSLLKFRQKRNIPINKIEILHI